MMGTPDVDGVDLVAELRAEVAELRAIFDLQWERMGAAAARWRAEDPLHRANTLPDLGALLQWLMDDADRARTGGWYLGRCGNAREPDGQVCTADLYAPIADAQQVKCPECGAWAGVDAPGRPRRPTDPPGPPVWGVMRSRTDGQLFGVDAAGNPGPLPRSTRRDLYAFLAVPVDGYDPDTAP